MYLCTQCGVKFPLWCSGWGVFTDKLKWKHNMQLLHCILFFIHINSCFFFFFLMKLNILLCYYLVINFFIYFIFIYFILFYLLIFCHMIFYYWLCVWCYAVCVWRSKISLSLSSVLLECLLYLLVCIAYSVVWCSLVILYYCQHLTVNIFLSPSSR